MKKEDVLKAITEVRKSRKRNFNQTFDFIINLKDFDLRKEAFSTSVTAPYPSKEIKICAFLERNTDIFDKVIIKQDFDKIEKDIKDVVNDYDFCVASAKLMPEIAKRFGRVLGPIGKMPDPKIGSVIMSEEKDSMVKLYERLKKLVRIRPKEKSIKTVVGKESMKDEEIAENCEAIYNALLSALPNKNENVKSVMIKLTMSKPVKINADRNN